MSRSTVKVVITHATLTNPAAAATIPFMLTGVGSTGMTGIGNAGSSATTSIGVMTKAPDRRAPGLPRD